MSSLPTPLRKQLATAIQRARVVAENGALNALRALAVHEPDPYRHMDEGQRQLRRKLRAQARQLGDVESTTQRGTFGINHLVEKLAYDQWHRLLFARFLLENNLLISPEHQVPVSLDDCEELAPSEGVRDAWAVAARYAAKALPEIFRADDPAGAVDLPLEDRAALVGLVTGLASQVFTAGDSLGWCYQFWQAEEKDAVNASGAKIGADELPSVTQLFTEDYMVDFLLDNTLGAWHANKVLASNQSLAVEAKTEEALRLAVALPGCSWSFLRFLQGADGQWKPAAGSFENWPNTASELTSLDPCMGSGHFVVAMFERLVALRVAEEALDEAAAVAAVICDNVFGLEIDPRCTQIAAFNLALAAWRRVGYCKLPAMNLACSGLAPNTGEANWVALAGEDEKGSAGMRRLYRLFKAAPILGSLIDPRASEGDLLAAGFDELQPLLEKALAQGRGDEVAQEATVAAKGIARAAQILSRKYSLVVTNVPYLGRAKQVSELRDYVAKVYPDAKADLATCFVERCLAFCADHGVTSLVTPQNWLFLGSYKKLRSRLLKTRKWICLARVGSGAFETISGAVVNVSLVSISKESPAGSDRIRGFDVSNLGSPSEKALGLRNSDVLDIGQSEQLQNPDSAVVLGKISRLPALGRFAQVNYGSKPGQTARVTRAFWELGQIDQGHWRLMESSPEGETMFSGKSEVCLSQEEIERQEVVEFGVRGSASWGKRGVIFAKMSRLPAAVYLGEFFDDNTYTLIPNRPADLTALYCYASSEAFSSDLRSINQKLNVTRELVEQLPFDREHWLTVAAELFPQGISAPRSNDPTQWLFEGHPARAIHPLQVAVARLLGYKWPRQTGTSVHGCPIVLEDGLDALADDDGIVSISPIRGEAAAADRLRDVLSRAYGSGWSSAMLERLLAQADCADVSLETWLRNGFFEQHCALFQHRPFIWQIWDGRKDGFSALVNYHKLTHANLEKLTFSYLGDWIRRQQAAVDAGEAGGDARLQAAKELQIRLRAILEGEPPFDLFIRWKPLSQQAIGWHPDINDGVRMNIRPFLAQDIPGGKKGAGVLRARPNVKWEKDRGNEPVRDKKEFPWLWGWDGHTSDFAGVGNKHDGNRWNACHYTNAFKQRARNVEGKK
jgi:hypothetical protein